MSALRGRATAQMRCQTACEAGGRSHLKLAAWRQGWCPAHKKPLTIPPGKALSTKYARLSLNIFQKALTVRQQSSMQKERNAFAERPRVSTCQGRPLMSCWPKSSWSTAWRYSTSLAAMAACSSWWRCAAAVPAEVIEALDPKDDSSQSCLPILLPLHAGI